MRDTLEQILNEHAGDKDFKLRVGFYLRRIREKIGLTRDEVTCFPKVDMLQRLECSGDPKKKKGWTPRVLLAMDFYASGDTDLNAYAEELQKLSKKGPLHQSTRKIIVLSTVATEYFIQLLTHLCTEGFPLDRNVVRGAMEIADKIDAVDTEEYDLGLNEVVLKILKGVNKRDVGYMVHTLNSVIDLHQANIHGEDQ